MLDALSPASIWAELLTVVQTRGIFQDSKTFVDAVPRASPQDVLATYRSGAPMGDDELRDFILRHFKLAPEAGADLTRDGPLATRLPMREHIRQLWPALTRKPVDPPQGSSLLALARCHVVPGGRFRELYYWDSYFTMLGLRADRQVALVEAMLDDFCSLIERYGHVPNGTRTYYLSRSQPPLFYAMCGLSRARDRQVLARRLDCMVSEHDFWMDAALGFDGVCGVQRAIAFDDGGLLNRYFDASDLPREEAYREDESIAQSTNREPGTVFRELRAAAESGWDFSSRWFGDGRTLATIQTTSIIPVDLNAYLYGLEKAIAHWSARLGASGRSAHFIRRAQLRRATINRYLWSQRAGHFVDFDRELGTQVPALTAAALTPLFVGLATRVQAAATAQVVARDLLADGGLRTTLVETGEQWDSPNGWAPLQWIAVRGLSRYGYHALAEEIARRWLATVEREYLLNGRMLEKYDVERSSPGGGGEYPLQDGFGWTNGVSSALMDRYPSSPGKQP